MRNKQPPRDFTCALCIIGETAENKVCIGFVYTHPMHSTKAFIELVSIDPYLFTAFGKFLSVTGQKPQKLLGKSVNIPNMHTFSNSFGKC